MIIGELNPTVILALLIIAFTILTVVGKIQRFWIRELNEKREVEEAQAKKWNARYRYRELSYRQPKPPDVEQEES